MDLDSAMCREQAAYCSQLLSKNLDPRRRAQLERERQDWLVLAHEQETWRVVQAEARSRTFQPPEAECARN
jgi:hypothetical protein